MTNVLLIEDNPADVLLLQAAVAGVPGGEFSFTVAERLRDGAELLAQRTFDVVLLDLGLPDGNGIETLTRLQSSAGDTPILVLTGLADDAIGVEATRAGAEDYLVKGSADGVRVASAIRYAVERRRLAARLRSSERLLREAQHVAHLGSWEWDIATDRISFSDELREIYGGEPKELIDGYRREFALNGRKPAGSLLPDVAGARVVRPDGSVRFVAAHADVIRDAQGKPLRLVGVCRDVTEQKAAQESLRRSEEAFRRIVLGSVDCIITVDHEGRITEFNPAAEETFGYMREEVVGARFTEKIIPPRLRERYGKGFARHSLARGEGMLGRRTEITAMRRDGTEFPMELTVTGLGAEEPPVFSAFLRDLSERRKMEQQQRETEQRFRALIENSWDPVCLTDAAGVVTYCSPAVTRTLGYHADEVVGRMWLDFIHADDNDAARLHMAEALAQARIGVQSTERVRHKDGTWRLVECVLTNLLDDRAVAAVVNNFRDVTERHRAAEDLARIFDLSPDMICTIGFDGYFKKVNPAFQRTLGYTDEELLVVPFLSFVHADDQTRTVGATVALARGQRQQAYENRYRRKNGGYSWLQWSGTSDPEQQLIYAVCRDVTEQREALETLRRSQENLALAQRVSHTGSWQVRIENDTIVLDEPVEWSDETYRIFGLEPQSIAMTPALFFAEHVHPADRDRLREAVDHAVRSSRVLSLDHRIVLPDGQQRLVHEEGSVLPAADGRTSRLIGTVQDITERRKAEDRLREQAEMLNLAHDAIILRELESEKVVFWNTGAERLYGWTATEAVGRSIREVVVHAEVDELQPALEALTSSGEFRGELHHLTKDGREIIVNIRSTLVRDEEGQPRSVLSIISDITEHKKLESQFLRAQRLESIGTLASGVAHDLNNILAPILMSAPLLRDNPSPALSAKIIATIEESAERGAQIVKQVLTFARGVEGERVLVDPVHLVKELVAIAQETFPKSIRITARYPEDTWPVHGDPTQLHQVLLNLSVNARDAMPNGGTLVLSVENFVVDEHYSTMMPDAKPGPHVLIRATDTGAGMPRSLIDKIFDPFFTTKPIGKGTGLGLSTVLGIVKSHGGFVSVYSEIGSGTTFKVFLPAATAGTVGPKTAPDRPALTGNGETIVVVDDEPGIAAVTQLILEKNNYRVLTADDGPTALALCAQRMGKVDLVITDLMMPFMDGVTLIRSLKRMDPRIRFIASTGQGDQQRSSELHTLGVTTCLTKPYNVDRLLRSVHELLHGAVV